MILRRTHTSTDSVLDTELLTMREAEQRVAWCATDNLNMTRHEASRHAALAARAWSAGEPFDLNAEYRFELLP